MVVGPTPLEKKFRKSVSLGNWDRMLPNPCPLISAITVHTIMMPYSRKNLIFPTIPAPEIPPEITKKPMSTMVINNETVSGK